MPRNVGTNIYSIPPGTEGFPDTTIESEKYNTYVHDVETDLNLPRPISAGGTGANSADGALASLHAEKAGQEVTNFDTHVWIAGSFFSAINATAPPIALHAFSGIAHITDANNMVVEAVDLTDPLHTPWTRVKTAGVWGLWLEGVTKTFVEIHASITCADDPPTGNNAADNALWFESSTGLLYIKYNDGDSSQWTIACPQPDISTYAIKTEVDDDIVAAIDAKTVRYDTPQTLTPAEQAQARSNLGISNSSIASGANSIINSDFRINQAGYVSAAVLAAGAYGHDQWKAGASGGDYSFTQLKSITQITIASGKTLIHPIEDVNVVGGSYVLSWVGTAQARAGVNTLTPSGAYAGSPLLITGQTAGTVMSVEFNSGTLSSVKLEIGDFPSPYMMRSFGGELITCQRYYAKLTGPLYTAFGQGHTISGPFINSYIKYPATMRVIPTFQFNNLAVYSNALYPVTSLNVAYAGPSSANFQIISGIEPFTILLPCTLMSGGADGFLAMDARL